MLTVIERARRYAARCPVAVSGQWGHDATFHVAAVLWNGFELTEGDTLMLLREWNCGCQSPWSEAELIHKVRSVANARHSEPRGYVLKTGLDDALPPYELWQITTHQRANPTHALGHVFAFDDNAVRMADKLDERLVVPAGRRLPFPLVAQMARPQQRLAKSDFARFQLLLRRRGETITGLAAKTLMGRSHVSQVLHNHPGRGGKSRHKLRRVLTAEELTALGWQQIAPGDFEI